MKTIHIIPKEVYTRHIYNYRKHHSLDLSNGHVVSIGEIDDAQRKNLEAEDGVVPLPFLLSGELIGTSAANLLFEHNITENDTCISAALKLKSIHAAFQPSQF